MANQGKILLQLAETDPFSPFSFINVADVLSQFLTRGWRQGASRALRLTRITFVSLPVKFASDIIFFCARNEGSFRNLINMQVLVNVVYELIERSAMFFQDHL